MARMTGQTSLEQLRFANAQLALFFSRVSEAVVGTQEEIQMLLPVESALLSIGALLDQGLQQTTDRETRDEFVTYRANLVRLQRDLNNMQQAAMGRSTRLFAREKHLHAARGWCDASRATQ